MQILKKTDLKALKKARNLGPKKTISLLNKKGLTGRGGASFPTGKKWEYALKAGSKEKYVICNADEGEPGTFKDKFIIQKNPETLVEGILIASQTIGAKKAFIYLRGEYEHLKSRLEKTITKVKRKAKTGIQIEIVLGAGAYVCGEETAIIRSIEGFRGQPYLKPPYPPVEGLYGKPTVINNVETLTAAAQAILFDDWKNDLHLFSLSGDVKKPGVYELPIGINLSRLIALGMPEKPIKAVYFGCFGGCMPYKEIELTPKNICGERCVHGSCSVIAVDNTRSIVDLAYIISKFFAYESCGKCTPCREGSVRVLLLVKKIKQGKAAKADLSLLQELGEHIGQTSLCGLGQSCTNHILTSLHHFRKDFEDKLR